MNFLASLAFWKQDAPAPPPVSEYQLDCPGAEDLGRHLVLAVGAEQAARVWAGACSAVGVGSESPLDLAVLQRVAEHIEAAGGPAGTMAAAFGIRVRSYLFLTTRPVSHGREQA